MKAALQISPPISTEQEVLHYAICWQQIIKKVDISVAYSNRASAIFWSTLWAAVVFHEHISVQNIIGIIVIFAGIWMVNRDA